MFENRFLAGVVAGLPVSLLCIAYVLARRDAVVAAVVGHTPMTAEKIVLNDAVAASLGRTLPRLLAA
jgi:hypothetical protein